MIISKKFVFFCILFGNLFLSFGPLQAMNFNQKISIINLYYEEVKNLLKSNYNAQITGEALVEKGPDAPYGIAGFQVMFQEFSFNLYVKITPSTVSYAIPSRLNNLQFNAQGVTNCLSIEMNALTRESIIHWINSYPTCGLPLIKTGTFAMNFANSLNKSHLIKRSSLTDASMISCKKENIPYNIEAKLALIHMLKNNNTWYEGFGYVSTRKKSSNNFDYQYETIKSNIKNKSITEIKDEIHMHSINKTSLWYNNHLVHCSQQINIFDQLVIEFMSIFIKKEEQTLQNFILWVWNNKCELYAHVVRLLFLDKDSDSLDDEKCGSMNTKDLPQQDDFTWAFDYYNFNTLSSHMEKIYIEN